MAEWAGPSTDIKWRAPQHPDEISSDRKRWEWELTTAHEVKAHRPGIPLAPHETRTIKGTPERRDAQLARRFAYAGYELLEVYDRGTGWSGRRSWDVYFRRKGKRGWEYQVFIEGIDTLELLTAHTEKLRYWLWQETRESQNRHEKLWDHYQRREDMAIESYGKAAAGLLAYKLEGYYQGNFNTTRHGHRANLVAALAKVKEAIRARQECEERIGKRIGKALPRPVEGLVIGRTPYIRPTAA